MRKPIAAALFAVLATAPMLPTLAHAQSACRAGRAMDGTCVNIVMSERATTRSNLMVQRRISASQQATLPRYDSAFLSAGARDYIR